MHPHTPSPFVVAAVPLVVSVLATLVPPAHAAGPPPVIRKLQPGPSADTRASAAQPAEAAAPANTTEQPYTHVEYGPPQLLSAAVNAAPASDAVTSLPAATADGHTATASVTVSPDRPTSYEHDLLEVAIHHCENAGPRHAKPELMLKLLRLEEAAGLPEHMRGVTLAAWCGEAAYGVDNIVGDGGRAEGILQMHTLITRLCGPIELRNDPVQTAECWLWNLKRVRKKAVRRCGERRSWKAAELWLSQGGKKSKYSCKNVSGHVARLERWQGELRRRERRGLRYATFHERFDYKARDNRPFPPALPGRATARNTRR